ncbi:MAG: hypothetical protein AB9842_12485 [Bacteroidales bacterium]
MVRNNLGYSLCITSTLIVCSMMAQTQEDNLMIQSVIEQEKFDVTAVPENADLSGYEYVQQDLIDNPVNLGEINPLDLLRLEILDREETEALYRYQLDFGPMLSVYELLMVEGVPPERIKELARYVCFQKPGYTIPRTKELFKTSSVEFLLTGKRLIEKKAGYFSDTTISDSQQPYSGSPWQQKINFRLSLAKNFNFGVALKNEPGEQSLTVLRQVKFHHQSYYLRIGNLGVLKSLIIGDYGISFGQGLAMGSGNGMSLGRETDLRMQSRGLFPVLSEDFGFKGAATWLRFGSTGLCAFYSEKFSSTDAGIYVSGGREQWKSGISLIFQNPYDLSITEIKPYKYFSQRDDQFLVSWDSRVFLKSLILFHEICITSNEKIAALAGLTFKPAPVVKSSVSVMGIQGGWNNILANTQLVTSGGLNQAAIHANFQFHLLRKLDLNLETETFRYYWLRFATSSPSYKNSFHFILSFRISKLNQLDLYFKTVTDQMDSKGENTIDTIGNTVRHSFGLTGKFESVPIVTFKFSARAVLNSKPGNTKGSGWLITQDVSFPSLTKYLKLNLHTAFFDTDTYDERIYAWQADVYRGFSVPAYYYQGYQVSAVLQFTLMRGLHFYVKYCDTRYPGRPFTGSGNDKISGNKKSELTFQFRLFMH